MAALRKYECFDSKDCPRAVLCV